VKGQKRVHQNVEVAGNGHAGDARVARFFLGWDQGNDGAEVLALRLFGGGFGFFFGGFAAGSDVHEAVQEVEPEGGA
jgi:hypothetical protein